MRRKTTMVVYIVAASLLAYFIPLQPALAWTDRPAATTEDPAHAWTVVFENPMDTSTINSRNIYASTDQNGSSQLDGVEVSAADSTHALVAPPADGWSVGVTYYLIVTQNVLTSEGIPLEDAVRMQFTVQTPGQTAPTLPDNGIMVYLEDQPLAFTVPPQTIGGRVMVPMRPIFEAMGATLDWDSATQTATAVKGATTVITQIGNSNATINGVVQTLDVPPTAINGSTLAPLRFVAEAFGYHVKWDGTSQTAYISASDFPLEEEVSSAEGAVLTPDYWIPDDLSLTYRYFEPKNNGGKYFDWKWTDKGNGNYCASQTEEGSTGVRTDDCGWTEEYSVNNGNVNWTSEIPWGYSGSAAFRTPRTGQCSVIQQVAAGGSWTNNYWSFCARGGSLLYSETALLVGFETIQLSGNNYEAAHVLITGTEQQADSNGNADNAYAPLSFTKEYWLVKGIGLVKESKNGEVTNELISFQ